MTRHVYRGEDGDYRYSVYSFDDDEILDQISVIHTEGVEAGLDDTQIAMAVTQYLATLAAEYKSKLN